MTDPVVTVHHFRQARYCMKGSRTWFRRHGIDWNGFLINGVPASVLLATGDAMAEKPVAFAREEAAHGR